MQEEINATIIYFSPCKSTRARAVEFERQLKKTVAPTLVDITKKTDYPMRLVGEILVIVLPIYNNSLPQRIGVWLKNSELNFNSALICLNYGGVSRGYAMTECAQILKDKNINLVGGGFLPTRHCYIDKTVNCCNEKDINTIKTLIYKAFLNIKSKNAINFTNKNHTLLLNKRLNKYRDALFPKPYTDKKQCVSCNKCIEACPVDAINLSYLTNEKCIHCNACVNICEVNARIFKINKIAKFGIKFARIFNKKYKIL